MKLNLELAPVPRDNCLRLGQSPYNVNLWMKKTMTMSTSTWGIALQWPYSTSLTTKTMNSKDVIRFISINAPYKILNSLPFDMRIFLKTGSYAKEKLLFQNPNLADLLSEAKVHLVTNNFSQRKKPRPLREPLSTKCQTSKRPLKAIESSTPRYVHTCDF